MHTSPTISIVVPVYNAANYLEQCIQSITEQSYTNFELLLVDDGSTDGSQNICDDYAEKDKRIKVIHKANAGASAARNTGIDCAQGIFITFIDADDYVDRNYLSEFTPPISRQDADNLLVTHKGLFPFGNDGSSTFSGIDNAHLRREEEISLKDAFFVLRSSPIKLFSKRILNQYAIRFDTTLSKGEDILFAEQYLLAEGCQKVVITDYAGYHYRQDGNPNSLLKSYAPYEEWIDLAKRDFSNLKRIKEKFNIEDEKFNAHIITAYQGSILYGILSLFNPKNKDTFGGRYKKMRDAVKMLRPFRRKSITQTIPLFDVLLRYFPCFISYPIMFALFRFYINKKVQG